MAKAAVNETWIRRFSDDDRSLPFVCFPHAGGSASYFRPLSRALQGRLDVMAVQYPGRQDRRQEPCLTTITELAEESYRALEPLFRHPLALFGHSMGAVIAFEVARRMKTRLNVDPVALFLSGRRAPSVHREGRVHLLDDRDLAGHLRETSGTDARILEDPEVLKMILPPLRSDYRAIETYQYEAGPELDCPMVTLVGQQDETAGVEDVAAWQDQSRGPFFLEQFHGGHFYLADHMDAVADLVSQRVLVGPG
ncbi:alpha/beta fold hydrolase [Streptomyces sp. NPDC005955]|uniref:thioesterase II family protein n=1 Tax=Streptomyces sp. NPDC005955 TaxID=3364738 RepID=UPI00369970D0